MKNQDNEIDEIDKILYDYFKNNKTVPIKITEGIKKVLHKKRSKIKFTKTNNLITENEVYVNFYYTSFFYIT